MVYNSVRFRPQNGTPDVEVEVAHGATASPLVPQPTLVGHTFAGWWTSASGGELFDFSTPMTTGRTLYAYWTINSYEVTFEPGNGELPIVENTEYGTPATAPLDPVRARYSFAGWHTSPSAHSPYSFSSPITLDLSLYAHWQRLPVKMTAPAQATPGQTTTITGDVFDPDENIEIWLLSTPILLTTTSADTSGAFSVNVTIPADVPVGSHHIEVRGLTTATIASPIEIVAASGDSGSLASTGADTTATLWTALVLIAVGLALLAFAQRGMTRYS